MKKHDNIKALPLLFAWFIIFIHSIIPHNHHDELSRDCTGMVHEVCLENHNNDINKRFNDQHSGGKVCHISGLLFHHIVIDNLIFPQTGKLLEHYTLLEGAFEATSSFDPVHGFPDGTTSLRAPPLS